MQQKKSDNALPNLTLAGKLKRVRKPLAKASGNTFGKQINHFSKLQIGDVAPHFTMRNASGQKTNLEHYIDQGPVVLIFSPVLGWLHAKMVFNIYKQLSFGLKSFAVNLLAISSQDPAEFLSNRALKALDFEVLIDVDNQVGKLYTRGTNLELSTSSINTVLKVPAIFIVDHTGLIILAKTEGNKNGTYIEPGEILQVIRGIQNEY